MKKYYKKYFKCIKCNRRYGTDNPKAKPRLCPVCSYFKRENYKEIRHSVIRSIIKNEKRNNEKKDK